MSKTLKDLKSMSEFKVGLWCSPYVKIYSIGGKNRIAEISNYPRAYKDTTPHDYIEDIPFIVTEDDLNHMIDGKEVYIDSRRNIFHVGEEATHWKGDPLAGIFPLWIESENLPFIPNLDHHVFPIDKIPAPIVDLSEGEIKVRRTFIKLSRTTLANIRRSLSTGKIILVRKPTDKDKQIIRIRYRRVL